MLKVKPFKVYHFAAPQDEIIFSLRNSTLKKVHQPVCSFIKILYIGIPERARHSERHHPFNPSPANLQ
jgi:hypothetical protein